MLFVRGETSKSFLVYLRFTAQPPQRHSGGARDVTANVLGSGIADPGAMVGRVGRLDRYCYSATVSLHRAIKALRHPRNGQDILVEVTVAGVTRRYHAHVLTVGTYPNHGSTDPAQKKLGCTGSG